MEKDNRYFMPRVGMAYRPTEKWVMRVGAGWFVSGQQMENFNIIGRTPPNGGSYTFMQVTDVALSLPYSYGGQNYNIQTRKIRPGTDVLSLDNMFPTDKPAGSRVNLLVMPVQPLRESWQWSFDLQRALPFKTFLTVGYIGSVSSHLDTTIPGYNNAPPSSNTDINSRRPYQAYVSQGEGNTVLPLGTIRYLDSYESSNYHALQAVVEKRYSNGMLTFGANYTYGKALGDNGGPTGIREPVYSPMSETGAPTTADSRSILLMLRRRTLSMTCLFCKRFKGVAGAILGGWQTNGIVTLKTGLPFSPNGGADLNTGSAVRPDRLRWPAGRAIPHALVRSDRLSARDLQ